jgi:hypothetical protein
VEIVILGLLTLVASIILGVTGFGFAVFLMGFFSLIVGIVDANVLITFLGIPIPIYMFIPLRKHIKWNIMGKIIIGTALGLPLGVWGIVRIQEWIMMLSLGIFIILYLGFDIFIKKLYNKKTPMVFGYIAGAVGGAFAGGFAAGGPPVVAFLSSLDVNKYELKAHILLFIIFATFYKVIFLFLYGLVTVQGIMYSAILVVPSFIGVFIGMYFFKRISSHTFQWIVQAVLFVIAIVTIIKAVT